MTNHPNRSARAKARNEAFEEMLAALKAAKDHTHVVYHYRERPGWFYKVESAIAKAESCR